MGPIFHEALATFHAARQAYTENKYDACRSSLNAAKKNFIHFPSYFNPNPDCTSAFAEEVILVREVLEYECLCAAREGNTKEFESAFAQLHTYYTDFEGAVVSSTTKIPESSRTWLLMGIHLLCLLVQNRIGAFHVQLERIPSNQLNGLFIRPIVELERYLLEGAYTRLLQSRATMPTNDYAAFLDALTQTVSDDIAQGITASYSSLKKKDAIELLMLNEHKKVEKVDHAQVEFYIKKYAWKDQNDTLHLPSKQLKDEHTRGTLNFQNMLNDQLEIAMELQRIV